MAEPAPLLDMQRVSVKRGGKTIIDEINLAVKSGEVVLLTGENGAGKSTLLEAAAGILPIASGTVHHSGEEIRKSSGRRRTPVPFGLTLQSGGFCQDELVDERVQTAVRMGGRNPTADWINERLREWGLRHRAGDRIAWLSGGMKRRLGVLCGLTCGLSSSEPRLLLLDEPSEGLDSASIATLCEQISRLAAAGHALVIATHDDQLSALATRTLNIQSDGIDEEVSTAIHDSKSDLPVLDEDSKQREIGVKKWFYPLEKRTLASTIPSVSAGGIALITIIGLMSQIELPSDPIWQSALILLPAFLASLTPPGSLRFLNDSRSQDWWNGMLGQPLQMSRKLRVISWGMVFVFLATFLISDDLSMVTVCAALAIGVINLASAKIYALESTLPRQGATFSMLLLFILIWPYLLLTEFVAANTFQFDSFETLSPFFQAILIPLFLIMVIPLIGPE